MYYTTSRPPVFKLHYCYLYKKIKTCYVTKIQHATQHEIQYVTVVIYCVI